MIINIRGTSGSGKSTMARELMALYPCRIPRHIEGRKQPIMYVLTGDGHPPLSVLGHYETACGGCDTITSLDTIGQLAAGQAALGHNVLMEGLLWSAETRRTIELAGLFPLTVIALDIPLQVCLDSVNQRRWAKDPTKPPVNAKNTMSKHKAVQSTTRKMAASGVTTHVFTDRAPALALAKTLLRL